MERHELVPVVLMIVMVGMLLGVGLVVFDAFSASAPAYLISNFNTTLSNVANNSATSLTQGNLTAVNYIKFLETQQDVNSSCYSVNQKNGSIKILTTLASPVGSCGKFETSISTVNLSCGFNYQDYHTQTVTSLTAISAAFATIGTNWLSLLITIIILAMIIVLIMKSFNFGGYQRK